MFNLGYEKLKNILEINGIKNYKKIGNWMMTNCLFHEDDNPSFGININDGGYNCFSCHESGNFKQLVKEMNC